MKTILFAGLAGLLILIWGAGCRQNDYRTFTITLAGVNGEEDRAAVRKAVELEGVVADSIRFRGDSRMELRFDSMKLARKNIEYAIAAAGYGANDIPARRPPTGDGGGVRAP